MRLLSAVLMLVCLASNSWADIKSQELNCLALNIYYEARGESVEGQRAVGLVTLNRMLSPKFPNDVCSVVYQPHQFSWTKKIPPIEEPEAFAKSYAIARQVLLMKTLGLDTLGALDFHSVDVNPYWKDSYTLVAVIDNHKFYRR